MPIKKRTRDQSNSSELNTDEFSDKIELGKSRDISDDDNDDVDQQNEESDGEPHEFPEIDVQSSASSQDDDDDDSQDFDSDDDTSLASFSSVPSTSSNVSDFISKSTRKPDENDYGEAPPKAKLGFEATARTVKSNATGEDRTVYREIDAGYGSDSSTEEDQNKVGNVPSEWYDDMPHIGYDVNGKRILKPATKDELDRFLENTEGEANTVPSKNMQTDVKLTDDELQLIRRLEKGQIPDDAYDPYED